MADKKTRFTRAEIVEKITGLLTKMREKGQYVEIGLADPYMDNGECVSYTLGAVDDSGYYITGEFVFNDDDKDKVAITRPRAGGTADTAAQDLIDTYEDVIGYKIPDGKFIFKKVPDLYVDNIYWIETKTDFKEHSDEEDLDDDW